MFIKMRQIQDHDTLFNCCKVFNMLKMYITHTHTMASSMIAMKQCLRHWQQRLSDMCLFHSRIPLPATACRGQRSSSELDLQRCWENAGALDFDCSQKNVAANIGFISRQFPVVWELRGFSQTVELLVSFALFTPCTRWGVVNYWKSTANFIIFVHVFYT